MSRNSIWSDSGWLEIDFDERNVSRIFSDLLFFPYVECSASEAERPLLGGVPWHVSETNLAKLSEWAVSHVSRPLLSGL